MRSATEVTSALPSACLDVGVPEKKVLGFQLSGQVNA